MFFSAKKDDTFILLENDEIHYLIGLESEPKNFEIQASAEKFTYRFRDKITSEPTFLNTVNFNF